MPVTPVYAGSRKSGKISKFQNTIRASRIKSIEDPGNNSEKTMVQLLNYAVSKTLYELYEYHCHAGGLIDAAKETILLQGLKRFVNVVEKRQKYGLILFGAKNNFQLRNHAATSMEIIKEETYNAFLITFVDLYPKAPVTNSPDEWLEMVNMVRDRFMHFFTINECEFGGSKATRASVKDWNTYLDDQPKVESEDEIKSLFPKLSKEEQMILVDNMKEVERKEVNYDYSYKK